MDKQQTPKSIQLTLPADMEYALVARLALNGFGLLVGLDVDLLDDLRTVTNECCDCLLHQAVSLREITISAQLRENRLHCRFCAVRGDEPTREELQDMEITRCILESLLPDVELHCDKDGVCCIELSMPV
ncbi:MAG: hypothetical protein GXY67_05125 [Clostridiales bacterium]|nr:hypothetical protein [Clostridiales bacterium]